MGTVVLVALTAAVSFTAGYAVGRRRVHVLLGWLLAGGPAAAGPAEVWATAAEDLRAIDPTARRYQRYLTDYAVPEKDRGEFERVLRFHWNSLSTEAEFDLPVVVAPDLYRVDLRGVGMKEATWEKLAEAEPYFHERLEKLVLVKPYTVRGKKRIQKRKSVLATSRWVPADAAAFLVGETGSQVPLVRADWFWAQTVVQANRRLGYYDVLGLKKRADFERLVGLSVKRAQARKSEVAAIIRRSGVAQNNRQVFRFGAVDSGAWRTLDVLDEETGRRNAVRNLDRDFVHDAEEHYGFLPNGLFAYYLSDVNGNPQDTAPDKIGPDKTATGNDGRIHAYLSCVRCHKEGLRPLDDYARVLFQAPGGLSTDDYERFKRNRQLYLGELRRFLVKDNQEYEFNLARLTGWKPAQLSAAYVKFWKWYQDTPVTLAQAALELGFPAGRVQQECTKAALPPPVGVGKVDPVLADFAREPAGDVNRQQWEEAFQLASAVLRGAADP